MPFRSEKQRRYLWKHEPQIAGKWAHEDALAPKKKRRKKKSLDAMME